MIKRELSIYLHTFLNVFRFGMLILELFVSPLDRILTVLDLRHFLKTTSSSVLAVTMEQLE